MHFAIHKLSPSPNPRVQRYYTLYIITLILIQFHIIFSLIYHGRLLSAYFDPVFPFHMFLTWITSFGSIVRFVEHVQHKDFVGYIQAAAKGKTVGRFDVVFAVLWALSYVMLPFALFGDFKYLGVTYLIPLPVILGFSLARWLYARMLAEWENGGYIKVSADENAAGGNDDELPLYEEAVGEERV
ncbi:hypothetical protein H072_4447 [Dactylellina haptotyla CBS 200.50]|uniref:Uncharacterized protein n=1 Tax=Dactylellina haptotyla (strain CBS 200.50) TaxID=1284197 RepID=S8BQE0_DACHA|nr:hypothetical protein H072_4447 [Dactylellina haptotyla CBS 200.50]